MGLTETDDTPQPQLFENPDPRVMPWDRQKTIPTLSRAINGLAHALHAMNRRANFADIETEVISDMLRYIRDLETACAGYGRCSSFGRRASDRRLVQRIDDIRASYPAVTVLLVQLPAEN